MTARAAQRHDRQVVRILGILKLLSEGNRPSVHHLAARFRTRRETIYRDLRALQVIGYPIAGNDEGRLKHPQLSGVSVFPLKGLSSQEVEAVLWAVKQAGAKEPYTEPLRKAERKIRLYDSKSRESESFDETLFTVEEGPRSIQAHQAAIMTLVEAILCRRSCLIQYQMPMQERIWKIQFDPYRLITTQGGLYSIGWLPSQKRLITLAVERIQWVEMLDLVYSVAPGINLQKLVEGSFGIVWERPMNVVIRFRSDQSAYVAERQWHPNQKVRYLKDGRLELSFKAVGTFEITRWILGWGEAAEVLHPEKLRQHLAKRLMQASALYSSNYGKTGPLE